ncbi:MAG TPA: AMP-binding protein, partial [Cyanophyceae cyanobacterium]
MEIIDSYSLKSDSNTENLWQDYLRGFTASLKLPAITHFPASHLSRGTQELRLSSKKTLDLSIFTQNNQLSLYTLIQGAVALLLSCYCRETDILFGVMGIPRQVDSEESIHVEELFCNTLPVRVFVNPDASLLSWLKELEAQWIALGRYASVPWTQIREWSEVPPELPLFETLVIFENAQRETELQGLVRSGKCWIKESDYPLVLSVDAESDWLLKIKYEQSQFSDDAIARMLGHLETLLTSIIANAEQPLAQVPLLTAAERHQLLIEWNQTETDYPKDKCIHQLFEEQVEKTPDAVAVVLGEQQLTYRELNCRANQLAHYLQKLGVKPEVLVGICADQSLEMVIGLLGILKAGGAYVPLDPAYPSDRLTFMLEDAKVSVLLTQHSLIEKLPNHQGITVCLDTDWKTIERESQENSPNRGDSQNLAYVIYTSGSTGQPKGV